MLYSNSFTRDGRLSEHSKKELNKKMYIIKLLSILFIGYIIFTVQLLLLQIHYIL